MWLFWGKTQTMCSLSLGSSHAVRVMSAWLCGCMYLDNCENRLGQARWQNQHEGNVCADGVLFTRLVQNGSRITNINLFVRLATPACFRCSHNYIPTEEFVLLESARMVAASEQWLCTRAQWTTWVSHEQFFTSIWHTQLLNTLCCVDQNCCRVLPQTWNSLQTTKPTIVQTGDAT